MSECCQFISTKFTRIYHLRDYLSKCSSRGVYPWIPLDNYVHQGIYLGLGARLPPRKKKVQAQDFFLLSPLYNIWGRIHKAFYLTARSAPNLR